MLSLLQKSFGALIGVFLALFFISQAKDYIPNLFDFLQNYTDQEISLEDMVPGEIENPKEELGLSVVLSAELINYDTATNTPKTASLGNDEPLKETPSTTSLETGTTTPKLSATELNNSTRNAIVNILCKSTWSGDDAVSGSGVFIDERGVVLTSAHVAQYFLLDTYKGIEFINCSIRTGSPAKKTYSGKLLYLPSKWLELNAENINKGKIQSTGEHDYALLYITPDTEPVEYIATLPITNDVSDIYRNEDVLIASYPAGFLGGSAINNNLWLISSFSKIKELYHFASSTNKIVDVFSVQGTVGAQGGSSGGAVVGSKSGNLLGLITTRSKGDTTGERELYALSLFYINEHFSNDLQKTLLEFLSGDIEAYAGWFEENVTPKLKERLIQELEK